MPTILEVLVDGISVYFPDISGADTFTVAVLGTGFLPAYTPRHVAHLLIDEKYVRSPVGQTGDVDEILRRQDVVLYDGSNPIAAGPQVRQLDRVLKLTRAPFNLPASLAGIADRETLHQHCSARVTFRGGTVKAVNPTPDKWWVVEESDWPGLKPKTKAASLMQGLKFTRELKNDWMVVEVVTGGTVNFRYELMADKGKIKIGISNEDVPSRLMQPRKNRDEDFRLVYKLFGYPGPTLHFPQQAKAASYVAEGVHLPCVGGCTC